ncbi:MAG: GNAT family N-acetyltransferase [Geminicoccaceae bacterium]
MAILTPIKQRVAALLSSRTFAVDPPKHIVDVLIEERAGHLLKHPLIWQAFRQLFYPLLKFDEAIRITNEIAGLSGIEVFNHISRKLEIRAEVRGLELVPKRQLVFIVANHPTGIADGIAVYDGLATVRPDLCFMANRDAIRELQHLVEHGLT